MIMEDKPNYVPPHQVPVWLSSGAVLDVIDQIALNGADEFGPDAARVLWCVRLDILALIDKHNSTIRGS